MKNKPTPRSKYYMGWLLVLFDLPTDTKEERREASRFRNALLDSGFLMLQYSVYAKNAVSVEKKNSVIHNLKIISPTTGNIQCIFITDAQWGNIITISAAEVKKKRQIDAKASIGEQLQFW